jgi:hypothetical protein
MKGIVVGASTRFLRSVEAIGRYDEVAMFTHSFAARKLP